MAVLIDSYCTTFHVQVFSVFTPDEDIVSWKPASKRDQTANLDAEQHKIGLASVALGDAVDLTHQMIHRFGDTSRNGLMDEREFVNAFRLMYTAAVELFGLPLTDVNSEEKEFGNAKNVDIYMVADFLKKRIGDQCSVAIVDFFQDEFEDKHNISVGEFLMAISAAVSESDKIATCFEI